jgi:hypothetical protein
MAISSFIDMDNLTYCGKEASEIFSKEIYSLDLRNMGITFMDGVKGKQKIYTGEVGDLWQEYTCPFTPEGEVVLSEATIEPVAIKINLEECYDVFWPTYLVEQTEITLNGGIPQTFFDWFFNQRLQPQMEKEYQEIFWRGNTDYSGATKQYLAVTDGVEAILEANSGTTKIDGASAFTVDNIEAQVEAVASKILEVGGDMEVDTDNYKIFMNKHDIRLLIVALGKDCQCNTVNSVFKNYTLEGDKLFVYGFEVVPTEQSRNTIIAAPANNLVLGYDTFDSHLEYRIIDMRESTGDNAFRVIALSNIAVGVVYPEIAVYSRAE